MKTPAAQRVQTALEQLYPQPQYAAAVINATKRMEWYDRTFAKVRPTSRQLFSGMTPQQLAGSLAGIHIYSNLESPLAWQSLHQRPVSYEADRLGLNGGNGPGEAHRRLHPSHPAAHPRNPLCVTMPGVPVRLPDGSVVHPSVMSMSTPFAPEISSPDYEIYTTNGALDRQRVSMALSAIYDSLITQVINRSALPGSKPFTVWMTDLFNAGALDAWQPADRKWLMDVQAQMAAAAATKIRSMGHAVTYHGAANARFAALVNSHLGGRGHRPLPHAGPMPAQGLKSSDLVLLPSHSNAMPGDPLEEGNPFAEESALNWLYFLAAGLYKNRLPSSHPVTVMPQTMLQQLVAQAAQPAVPNNPPQRMAPAA